MELRFINYTYKEKTLNFDLPKKSIIGLTGQSCEELLDILSLRKLNKGQLTIDEVKVTKDNINDFRRRISVVDKILNIYHHTVYDLMIDYIKEHSLTIKDPIKKIKDSLKIVELPVELLSRTIYSLSQSEKKLLQVAVSLLSNPSLIILNEPFKCLDKQNEKKLVMLLQRLKEQFQKTILIISDDSNKLYKYTTDMIFIKNDEILLTGPTNEVYLRVDYLKRNKFEIPPIVEFTYIVKKKKEVKIEYHKDVRDIIKDIYKHI